VRQTKDGRTIPVSARGSPIKIAEQVIGLSTIDRDLRFSRGLQEQLNQAQKMEAVGQLASGIAHDFNNLLTIINGYSDIALDLLSPDDASRKPVEEIRDAGIRAVALTGQLLAFSRKQIPEVKVVDVNETIDQIGKMLRRLIGENVQLTSIPGPDLAKVMIDPGQLEQVLMNLAVNARDAMKRGGNLTITTSNIQVANTFVAQHGDCLPVQHVLIAVSDTGCGMSKKTQDRIFEPFFTTKEIGKGTGLGLAVVHNLVKAAGGFIGIISELGKGTTFQIYLPAMNQLSSPAIMSGIAECSEGNDGFCPKKIVSTVLGPVHSSGPGSGLRLIG
jgi:two-component system, cell cycle sensor histidine kinase and response regulator CckA